MCLIPGLADGKYLTSNEFLPEELATESVCLCGPAAHAEHDHGVSRREMVSRSLMTLGGLAMASTLAPAAAAAQAPAGSAPLDESADGIIFLGTGGGPVITQRGGQPATAVRVNGIYYLVDAGADIIRQLQRAGIPLAAVRHLFITHNHSDHMAGYPALATVGWTQPAGALQRLDIWGPQQRQMHTGLLELFGPDIASREFLTGIPPFKKVVHAHEVNLPFGDRTIHPVFEDNNVRISAIRVLHGTRREMPFAYGYRFDVKATGKSVVFSGDTAPTDNTVKLAADCDVLVHEAMSLPGIEQLLAATDPAVRDGLRQHLVTTHTDVTVIPRIAQRAGAKRMVLTHYVPGFLPAASYLSVAQQAAAVVGYGGEVLAASDGFSLAL
jgi:ribonuclease BN (tRNA processing enzyme)